MVKGYDISHAGHYNQGIRPQVPPKNLAGGVAYATKPGLDLAWGYPQAPTLQPYLALQPYLTSDILLYCCTICTFPCQPKNGILEKASQEAFSSIKSSFGGGKMAETCCLDLPKSPLMTCTLRVDKKNVINCNIKQCRRFCDISRCIVHWSVAVIYTGSNAD